MAIKFTDDNFEAEVVKSDKPVLVDFYADWCGPCQMMAPAIDELATEVGDKFKVGKLNVDENPKIAGEFGVRSIPTLIFFKDGKAVDTMMGVQPKEGLKKHLEEM